MGRGDCLLENQIDGGKSNQKIRCAVHFHYMEIPAAPTKRVGVGHSTHNIVAAATMRHSMVSDGWLSVRKHKEMHKRAETT